MTAAGAGAAPGTAPAVAAAPTTLGVLGGGQLGRMFVHAAQAHGFRVAVLEPDAASPAGAAADVHLRAPYADARALADLRALCTAITTEFENVPADVLRELATSHVVSPPAAAVEICQHRVREKQCFAQAGVRCAPYARVESLADAHDERLDRLLPGILKTSSLGYDGKGQAVVSALAELPAAWTALGCAPCVLEQRLPLCHEISVIVARGADGSLVHLPVQQNLHRGGILALTQVPAPDIDVTTAALAVQQAGHLATALHYVGVLCVEFFVLADGSLVANEMAPRPHNSGHYSIDACDLSQFDLQLRTLVGWPLVAPRQHSAAVMLNLLGDLWFSGGDGAALRAPDWASLLALPGVHLHLYGKAEPRRGRKMGHITVTAPDGFAARATALRVSALLGLAPF